MNSILIIVLSSNETTKESYIFGMATALSWIRTPASREGYILSYQLDENCIRVTYGYSYVIKDQHNNLHGLFDVFVFLKPQVSMKLKIVRL